jgi:plasmid stabilization system protein ParE
MNRPNSLLNLKLVMRDTLKIHHLGLRGRKLRQEYAPVVLRKIIVLPEAEADVALAYDWYEQRENGLGEDFLAVIRKAQTAISGQPEIYPLCFKGFRRYLVHRFPYAIYFISNDKAIFIVAVSHSSRHPDRLRKRLKNF